MTVLLTRFFRITVLMLATIACAACDSSASGDAVESAGSAAAGAPQTAAAAGGEGVFIRPQPPAARPKTGPTAASGPVSRVEIRDSSGPVPIQAAATVEVPDGWQPQGGVIWNRNVECVGNMRGIEFTATSPDGMEAFAIMSPVSWQVERRGIVPTNPCPGAQFGSVREYLTSVIDNARPGSRILSWRDRPDLIKPIGSLPPGMRQWREAAEVLIVYPLGGADMRETLTTSVTFSELQGAVMGWSDGVTALRAPDGSLNSDLADRIRRSFAWNPAYVQASNDYIGQRAAAFDRQQKADIASWHARRMNEISTQGILRRGQIRRDTILAISATHREAMRNQQASIEHRSRDFQRLMRDEQPWIDPKTGAQTDLSIHYRYAWKMDDGTIYMTNRIDDDPNRFSNVPGHRMEMAPEERH